MRTSAWLVLGIALVLSGCQGAGRRPAGEVASPQAKAWPPDDDTRACVVGDCHLVEERWPCHMCPYPAENTTAKCKLQYILDSTAGAVPGTIKYRVHELALKCIADDGYMDAFPPAITCGATNDYCCWCVSEAYHYAVQIPAQWGQCASKLGHGHGGGQSPP